MKKILNSKFLYAFLVGINFDNLLNILGHGSKHFVIEIGLSLFLIISCSWCYYAMKKAEEDK